MTTQRKEKERSTGDDDDDDDDDDTVFTLKFESNEFPIQERNNFLMRKAIHRRRNGAKPEACR
jgi:hypothetical protein